MHGWCAWIPCHHSPIKSTNAKLNEWSRDNSKFGTFASIFCFLKSFSGKKEFSYTKNSEKYESKKSLSFHFLSMFLTNSIFSLLPLLLPHPKPQNLKSPVILHFIRRLKEKIQSRWKSQQHMKGFVLVGIRLLVFFSWHHKKPTPPGNRWGHRAIPNDNNFTICLEISV